jgi:hypothetical protein
MQPPAQQPSTVAAQPTRQQLDDLEALMQRMLALPVNPVDDLVTPPPAPANAEPITVNPAWGTAGNDPPASSPTVALPVTSVPPIALVAAEPAAALIKSTVTIQEPRPTPVIKSVLRPTLVPVPNRPTTSAKQDMPPVPWWLWPLYGCDQAFTWLTNGFGWPGRWLQTQPARWLLGLCGLGMVTAAVVWVVLGRRDWTW